eukprot:10395995-Heterocapsa_arctica.AAC.1
MEDGNSSNSSPLSSTTSHARSPGTPQHVCLSTMPIRLLNSGLLGCCQTRTRAPGTIAPPDQGVNFELR